ncbi:MAG: hypothetical protein IPH33_01665 [Bacteroidetes bacterium]|nr:hypothetical protein [Bacteroidota bacterium]
MYDTRIARFFKVDPISGLYPELTPYQFANNDPIESVDIDGLEGEEAKMDGIERTDRRAAQQAHPNNFDAQNDYIKERRDARGWAVAPAFVVVSAIGIAAASEAAVAWAFCNPFVATEITYGTFSAANGYDGPGPNTFLKELVCLQLPLKKKLQKLELMLFFVGLKSQKLKLTLINGQKLAQQVNLVKMH